MNLRYGQLTSVFKGIWVIIEFLLLKYLNLLHLSNDLNLEVDTKIPLYFYTEKNILEWNWRKARFLMSIID